MSLAKKRKGELGERIAEAFLQSHGFHLVKKNWRCKYGEIDLIVRRGREYRFIEVKYRTSVEFGFPEEAVTEIKLKHIKHAIEIYLLEHMEHIKRYQIDVISILRFGEDKPKIYWIESV